MRYSFHSDSTLSLIKKSNKHLTADSIHRKLQDLIPNVSKMTVYRNLNQLLDNDEIIEFYFDGKSHYCGTETNHFHFACVSCNQVVDYKAINKKLIKYLDNMNFSPQSSGMIIKGLCNDCKKQD